MAAWGGNAEYGSENKGQGCVKGECAYNRMKKKNGQRKRGEGKIKLCNTRLTSIFIKVCLQGAVNNKMAVERRTASLYAAPHSYFCNGMNSNRADSSFLRVATPPPPPRFRISPFLQPHTIY